MQKGIGGMSVLLVLGLGMGLLRVASPSPGDRSAAQVDVRSHREDLHPPNQSEKCGLPGCVEKDLLDAVTASSPVAQAGDGFDKVVEEFQGAAKGSAINFAVAIVPDPIHTHLSLFFDRTIDAIQQGAQQAGWIFDRAMMPWDSQEHPESTDFRTRLAQEQFQDDKEALPGLMIFRRAYPDSLKSSLFIFVVGETPTGGVNKDQFRNAVKLIAGGPKAPDSAPIKSLRIIGPTFSGSLYSLAQLIDPELRKQGFGAVVVRSGTVSSWDTQRWFVQWSERQLCESGLRVDFATFQQSDRYMLRKFLEFEKRRGYTADKIAVLTEDETAYGNVALPSPPNSPTSQADLKKNSCMADTTAPEGTVVKDDPTLAAEEKSMLHLYFPRDISQLRSAYQQGLQQQSSSSSSTDSYQVHATLPTNLQDTGSDDDSVQQFAHSETPLSQESILLGMVAAIRERHIQFVVLQATNPMDTLFLSAFLKKGYSQARVVAMPADLLLSRDADDVSLLHGVMGLTTYSLLPDIDEQVAQPSELEASERADHVFPNAYAAGTYNAAISQIKCFEAPAPTPCDISKAPAGLALANYTEYGWPSLAWPRTSRNPIAPPVWLTVLGRGGFWPLAILDSGEKAGNIEASARPISSTSAPTYRAFKPDWPLFWGVICGVVLSLVAVFGLLLWKGSVVGSFSAMTLMAPVKSPHRSALIVIIGCLLLVGLLLLIWPWFAWATLPGAKWRFGAGVAVIALLYAGCTEELIRRRAMRAGWIFILAGAVLIGAFLGVYSAGSHSQTPFLYRYVHLTSGVSPLLPFLCLLAGSLWWAWFSLAGLALVDKRRPQLPSDEDLPAAAPPEHTAATVTRSRSMLLTERSAEKLVRVSYPAALDVRVYAPALAVLAVTVFSFDRSHPLLSLETGHFEWIYALSLAIVTFALFCTLFRLLVIWQESQKILATLDHFPLRRAFAELHFAWQPIWRLGGGRWQDLYRLISRQMETLEHLKAMLPQDSGVAARVLHRSIQATADQQDDLYKQYAALSSPNSRDPNAKEPRLSDYLINQYQLLQKSIGYTAAAALTYLQPKWWEKEGLILCELGSSADVKAPSDDDKSKDENVTVSLPTRLAERFVALVYLNFILTILLRMRTLAVSAGGLYIFLLLSVNSYPFEPRIALRSLAILMLMVIVIVVGYVFAQVHRDSILSLVTQTKPGELGIEFWLRMGSFVALPLISLLVSQFPTLNNALFSWLEPAVSALK